MLRRCSVFVLLGILLLTVACLTVNSPTQPEDDSGSMKVSDAEVERIRKETNRYWDNPDGNYRMEFFPIQINTPVDIIMKARIRWNSTDGSIRVGYDIDRNPVYISIPPTDITDRRDLFAELRFGITQVWNQNEYGWRSLPRYYDEDEVEYGYPSGIYDVPYKEVTLYTNPMSWTYEFYLVFGAEKLVK